MTDDVIGDLLERAYSQMDGDGFLPVTPCRVCGKPLSSKDGPRPAETYAGTATGLCYACSSGPAYVVPDSELPDGARLVSHPPASPSWRRDRTTHWGYPYCGECKGMGARMRYSSMNQYMEYCRPCMTRVTAPRKRNEIEFLRSVADDLEAHPLVAAPHTCMNETHAQDTVSEACTDVARAAMSRYEQTPVVWRPQRYLLDEAESRLTRAQLAAKRPETLRRHLVAALRAQADELASR
jgi:hypothetical protein